MKAIDMTYLVCETIILLSGTYLTILEIAIVIQGEKDSDRSQCFYKRKFTSFVDLEVLFSESMFKTISKKFYEITID